jgi:hypothetical protein
MEIDRFLFLEVTQHIHGTSSFCMLIIPKKSRPQLSPLSLSLVEIFKGIRIDSREEEEKKNSTERDDDDERFFKRKKEKKRGRLDMSSGSQISSSSFSMFVHLLLFEHLANTHVDVVAYLPVQNQIKKLESIQTKF